MTAKILPFGATKPVSKKLKTKRGLEVIKEVLDSCAALGEPDMKVFIKAEKDLMNADYTVLDMLAVYLYRKKLKG